MKGDHTRQPPIAPLRFHYDGDESNETGWFAKQWECEARWPWCESRQDFRLLPSSPKLLTSSATRKLSSDFALVLPIQSLDRLIEKLFLVIMGFSNGHLSADGLPFPPISISSLAVESQRYVQ